MTAPTRTRRSPRGDARARAMLEAATDVFIERGYAAASLDEIIERSGGSRRTLYDRFSNKQGLFVAVVEAVIDDVFARLDDHELDELPLEEGLVAIGTSFLSTLLKPQTVATFRTVIAEIPQFPELGRAFYAAGPEATFGRVEDFLRRRAGSGASERADLRLAARQFIEMIKGDLHLRAVFCVAPPPEPAEIERHVRTATRTFLRGIGERSG